MPIEAKKLNAAKLRATALMITSSRNLQHIHESLAHTAKHCTKAHTLLKTRSQSAHTDEALTRKSEAPQSNSIPLWRIH